MKRISPKAGGSCLCFMLVIGLTYSIQAQQVVSTAGETYETNTAQVSFTLGQTVIETYSDQVTVVTQGFHQVFDEVISGLEPAREVITVSVYPNPATDRLIVELTDSQEVIHYNVLNLEGQALQKGQFKIRDEIDLVNLTSGLYLLLLTNNREQLIQSFKIQVK